MKDMIRFGLMLTVFGGLFFLSSCTTTRWSVTEQFAVSPRQTPEILERTQTLIPTAMPTVNRPVLRLEPFIIEKKRFRQQIKVERSVQSYEMRPFFSAVTLSAASFALLAANTSLIFSPEADQVTLLNASAAALGLLSVLHLKPVGEPIPTGESRYLRESGFELQTDTLRAQLNPPAVAEQRQAAVDIYFGEKILLSDPAVPLREGALEINLSAFTSEYSERYLPNDEVWVDVVYEETSTRYEIPLRTFMETYVEVDEDIARLLTEPYLLNGGRDSGDSGSDEVKAGVQVTEIGKGSSLQVTGFWAQRQEARQGSQQESRLTTQGAPVEEVASSGLGYGPEESGAEDSGAEERWLKVRYGARELFMAADQGFLKWFSDFADEAPLILELQTIAYGEVDIEQSIPVLRAGEQGDEAVIITNIFENEAGSRQYLQRSHRLFEDYMTTAFRIGRDRMQRLDPHREIAGADESLRCIQGKGRMFLYLSGFGTIRGTASSSSLYFYALDENLNESLVPVQTLFQQLLACQKDEIVVFVDLDLVERLPDREGGDVRMQREPLPDVYPGLASVLVDRAPNSAVFFASLPGQPSSLYSGSGLDDKRHTIFMYYIAEGWKKRLGTVGDLERHLSSNVDYTSRRLHDRPQEVAVFGNRNLRFPDR